MNNYQIGKVIGVTGDEIFVSLLDHEKRTDLEIGVPESMIVHLSRESGPIPVLIGQPGTFVIIALPAGLLLCMVTSIAMHEIKTTASELRESNATDTYLIDKANRGLTTIAVGTIDSSDKFERGADVLPTINAPVFVAAPELIDKVYSSYAEGDFTIGKLSLIPNQDSKINLDAFLTRHAAILGQTGGGKSWTVASLIQKMCKFEQATIVLFDLHGEYAATFGDSADVISASNLELPYWLMNSEELLGLMVDRSESTAPNQIAKFKELLQAAKDNYPENKTLGIKKITIDTPVFFEFVTILDEFRRLNVQKEPGDRGSQRQGPLYGQFTRLLMRIDSRLNDKRYDLIFKPIKYTNSASMEDLFRRLLGETIEAPKKVVVVDLSPVPFDVRSSVISLILRCLFDFAYWYRRVHKMSFPIAVFADEAHIYLRDGDPATVAAKHSAERIAKEGRKYGISLTVISQRPREVSATILSQCNSFLCLRISNPDDQSYVKSLLPDSIRGIASMFSTLRRGECILLGDSVMMPTRIKIDQPNPAPISEDASFYKAWNKLPEEINFAKVLKAWRNQDVAPEIVS
jgi:DNA helicase HerA-like ATPase